MFSACVVVDLVMGLSVVIFVDAPGVVGFPREELGESILLGGAVPVALIIAAIARPMRCWQGTSDAVDRWISRFALAQNGPECAFAGKIVHHGPFCTLFETHSGPFNTIRRNSRESAHTRKRGAPVSKAPPETPRCLQPMASGLFTGRSRRNVRPVGRSSRRGHWIRRS